MDIVNSTSTRPGGTKAVRASWKASHEQWINQSICNMNDLYLEEDSSVNHLKKPMQTRLDFDAITRVLPVQVIAVQNRTVSVQPPLLDFSLDEVECSFVPIPGDHLKLEAVYQVNPNSLDLLGKFLSVASVIPLLSQTGEGYVLNWSRGVGEIVADIEHTPVSVPEIISFNTSSCPPGYVPRLGDIVTFDAIESIQGQLKWRALKVLPKQYVKTLMKNNLCDFEVQDLLKDKPGIEITRSTHIGSLCYGETKNLEVLLANRGNKAIYLNAVYPHASLSLQTQFQLSRCPRFPYMLPSHAEVTLVFSCNAVSIGTSRDLFVFEFKGGIRIGRYLHVEVLDQYDTAPSTDMGNRARHQQNDQEKVARPVVRGQRPGVQHNYRRRLQHYKISLSVNNFVKDPALKRGTSSALTALYDTFPWLMEEITEENYTSRMHELLELEEAEVKNGMQRWSSYSVELRRSECQAYHILEVNGLTDGRPSLLIGDAVICKNVKGGPEYEGVVHKVKLNEIMLKFSEMFPCLQKQDRFFIRFSLSRAPFLRLHSAIDAAWHELGPSILFPSYQFKLQSPQVILMNDDDDDDCNNTVKNESFTRQATLNNNVGNTARVDPTQYNLRGLPYLGNTHVVKAPLGALLSMNCTSPPRVPVIQRLFNCTLPAIPVAHGQWKSASPQKPQEAEVTQTALSDKMHLENAKQSVPLETVEMSHIKMNQRRLRWVNPRLNKSQRAAVRNVLSGEARPLPYIIFGPPGTGKTVTLVETILQIYSFFPDSRLLIGTPSNSAADLLAEKLLDSKLVIPGDLLRLVAYSYKNLPARLVPYQGMAHEQDGGAHKSSKSSPSLHRITVGTCASLGRLVHSISAEGLYTHVLIDEAGQATEPETMLIAGLLGKPQQLILAGDPMQLGPVIQGRCSAEGGLSTSFLARLLHCGPYIRDPVKFPNTQGYNPLLVTMLVENYRSLPEILSLPARLFYHNELVATVSNTHGEEADLLWSLSKELPYRSCGPPALVFHGVRGSCLREEDSPSWYNAAEVIQVVSYIKVLYNHGVSANQIGIISPYNKQVHKIRDMLRAALVAIPKVGSVEEFQGQERMCIIFSAVRSSGNCEEDGLGFLSNPNRMNTAITRARALLIVIGDPYSLTEDPTWNALLEDCIKRKAYRGCFIPADLCSQQYASVYAA